MIELREPVQLYGISIIYKSLAWFIVFIGMCVTGILNILALFSWPSGCSAVCLYEHLYLEDYKS